MNEIDEQIIKCSEQIKELENILLNIENELIHGKRIEKRFFQIKESYYYIFHNTLLRNEIFIFLMFFITFFITNNFYSIWYNFLATSIINLSASATIYTILINNNEYKILKNEYQKYNINNLILKKEEINNMIEELKKIVFLLNNQKNEEINILNIENSINKEIKRERILK
ncbi:MAG: hypothetical protein E7172_04920 [Firmicutes bacterium]|nr:hypothetical protein [Bacillota bacterium]